MTKLVSVYHIQLSSSWATFIIILKQWPTCLFCFRLCQTYDYVYLIFKAMSSMTLLFLYLHIHFQFILFYIIFHQFKIYLFNQPITSLYFLTSREAFFYFLFAPCVPFITAWSTLKVIPLSVLLRFCCHLLRCVALLSLIIPLCCHQLSSSPSLRTVQSTGAFRSFYCFH
jgi:hypothetical protein